MISEEYLKESNSKLKPCPFCGGTAKITKDLVICDWFADDVKPFAISVGCNDCLATFIFAPSDTSTTDELIKTATKYWNRRTTKRRKSNENTNPS